MASQLETYISENENRFLEDLKGWLRIPSISTLPEHAGDVQQAAEYAADQLRRIGCDSADQALLEGVIRAQRERAKTMKEMAHNSRFFFVDRIEIDPKAAAKYLGNDGREALIQMRGQLDQLPQWNALAVHAALNDVATRLQGGLGKVAQPLRVAVTGTAVSPPIDVTLELLGRARTLERIDAALSRSPPGAA
jgi:glutamyl-tRNA synthetase